MKSTTQFFDQEKTELYFLKIHFFICKEQRNKNFFLCINYIIFEKILLKNCLIFSMPKKSELLIDRFSFCFIFLHLIDGV